MRYGAAICVGIRRSLAKAPRLVDHEIEPFTVDEAQLLLKTAMDRRNGVRWAIALALGLRQVEARPQVVRCRLGGGKSDGSTPTGAPINPRTDYTDWKRLLPSAGLRDARLHDARHTAATVLLILGVPERAVMGLMGWSHSAMAGRYQHVISAIQSDIASRVDGLIWQVSDPDIEQK